MKHVNLFFLIFLIVSCNTQDDFPFEDYDYTINNVNLGLSFVPDSSMEEKTFTAGHLSILNIGHIRMAQSWHLREPSNDAFNWQPLADRLDFYQQNNVSVLLTLDIKQFPDWTSAMNNTQIEVEFSEYITNLLANFGTQISYIQLGNEWNWEIDTYLGGDEDLFIALNNIVYDMVQTFPANNRPVVLLGSIAIGGLRQLALDQGRINNIYFDNTPLYTQSEIDASVAEVQAMAGRALYIMSNCNFSMLDLHFYDEYWNWTLYQAACLEVLSNAGKTETNYLSVMASEFGGPEPDLEGDDNSLKAERLVSYIHTLDNMAVLNAYYFKLVQENSSLIAHPNSYLIDSGLNESFSYEVMRRFGQ